MRKLREAVFFCRKLVERSKLALGDREEIDFYLSAFLSAARSVDYRLRHERNPGYASFRAAWDAALPVADQALVRFMIDDRNLEIHEKGSSCVPGEERLVIRGSYSDASGTVTVVGPPGGPPAEIIKPTFAFLMDGVLVPVDDACTNYIRLLEQMVNDYCRKSGAA